jgi:hypothetical protein
VDGGWGGGGEKEAEKILFNLHNSRGTINNKTNQYTAICQNGAAASLVWLTSA